MELNGAAYRLLPVLGLVFCVVLWMFYTDKNVLLPNTISYKTLPQATLAPVNMTGRCFITYELANFKFGRRLGNHLFDTAAVLALAHRNNMTALLPKGARVFLAMDVSSVVIVTDEQYQKFVQGSKQFTEINNRKYDNRTNSLPCNVTLYGFYQSWRYLTHYTEQIRTLIRFKHGFMDSAKELYKKYQHVFSLSNGDFPQVSVGIHARRGFTENADDGYVVAPPSYFEKAMYYFTHKIYPGKRVSFIISSDNMTWCKANIKGPNVIYSEAKEPAVDMALQSLCDATITTLGSFTWWCAFFAGGRHVTYYKDWFRPGSNLAKQINQTDMFYPNWVGIS